jgi:hypothetical protein
MSKWLVTMYAQATAEVTVEADSEYEALLRAGERQFQAHEVSDLTDFTVAVASDVDGDSE